MILGTQCGRWKGLEGGLEDALERAFEAWLEERRSLSVLF